MDVFVKLFVACIPLLLFLIIGYIAGKKLSVNTKSVSNLLIYIITPFVIFDGIYKVQLNLQTISIPLIIFVLACIMCIVGYLGAKLFRNDSRRNLLALSAGKGNYLYFGLPLALLFLGEEALPLRILMTMGFILYENTLGMYITAKGKFSAKESFIKILKIPNIRAFIVGLIVNLSGLKLPELYNTNVVYFKGAMIVLGTMLIGISLASIIKLKLNWKFIISTFAIKFIIWPLITLILIALDKSFFHFYNPTIYNILFIVSLVPLSVNSIAIATIFDLDTEDISVAILLSTLFAFIFIPLCLSLIGLY